MHINIQTGLLKEALQCPSPNCDARPEGEQIHLLVIHGISLPPGQFGGPFIDQLFSNCLQADQHPYFEEIADLRVSSHLLIRRDGQIVQYVPFHQRAWHAGESEFNGCHQCNDFSIGIELEGTDDQAYTEDQYEALIEISKQLMKTYLQIRPQNIVGHCDISAGRKTDPGEAFDWPRLRSAMA